MAIKKTSSSAPKAPPKKVEAPKPKAEAPKTTEVKKDNDGAKKLNESKKDGVNLSDEARGNREESRTGDVKDPNKPQEPGKEPQLDENGKPIKGEQTEEQRKAEEEREAMKKEIEEIKGLLEGLAENFAAKESASAQESGGGGESSGGGESGGPSEAKQAGQAQQAQQPQQPSQLDQTLGQLAIQVLTGGGGMGNPQFGQNPMNGNAQNGQLNMNGMQGMQGGMGNAQGSRNQLATLYAQTGGPQNKSVRPETHQLVQAALGLGGMGGGPMGGMIGAGAGNGFGVPTQMGVNPNFGGGFNAFGFG